MFKFLGHLSYCVCKRQRSCLDCTGTKKDLDAKFADGIMVFIQRASYVYLCSYVYVLGTCLNINCTVVLSYVQRMTTPFYVSYGEKNKWRYFYVYCFLLLALFCLFFFFFFFFFSPYTARMSVVLLRRLQGNIDIIVAVPIQNQCTILTKMTIMGWCVVKPEIIIIKEIYSNEEAGHCKSFIAPFTFEIFSDRLHWNVTLAPMSHHENIPI